MLIMDELKKKKEKIEKQNFRKKVLACVAGLVVAFMIMSGITLACQFELNKELNFSSLHFMMMGMNPVYIVSDGRIDG